jgi:type I restriction enzyme S subunit
MTDLIAQYLDVWTSALINKSTAGRGTSDKQTAYGIKKLRELILELAVRGKLVPQDPNDESADVILKSIKKEKAKLLSEKKIRDAKLAIETDMPEVDIKIPSGWRLVRVSDLLVNPSDDIVDGPFGSKLKATEYTEHGTPVIRIQNIDRGIFKDSGIQYISNRKAEELFRHSFIAGDVVLNKLGEPAGKTCVIPPSLESGVIVADIIRIRLNELIQNKRYFVNCMNSPFVSAQFAMLAKGVTRQRVNLSQVRALKVPIPPFNEQHRIVAKVDELMALCDQLEQQQTDSIAAHQTLVQTLLNTLNQAADAAEFEQAWSRIADHFDTLFTTEASIEQLKQTLLQLAVMGKLVPQDPNDESSEQLLIRIVDEKRRLINNGTIKEKTPVHQITSAEQPFNVPQNWKWARLSEITKRIHYGYTASANESITDVRLLRITDIQDNNVDWVSVPGCDISEKDIPQFELKDGDILVARTGGTVGKTYLVNQISVVAVFASYLIRIQAMSDIYIRYLKFFLESPTYWEQLVEGARGGAQPNVNGQTLGKMVVPVPPVQEQHRIVAKVDELMALCDALKARIAAAQTTQLQLADAIVEQVVA